MIQTINQITLRLFSNIITENSIVVKEFKTPFSVYEFKKLWILRGKFMLVDRWMDNLYLNHLCIDIISCYKHISNKFTPLFRYIASMGNDNELRDLQQFIKTSYPFDIISMKELTDVNKIKEELIKYCQMYTDVPEIFPGIEKIETQSIIEIIDEILFSEIIYLTYILSSTIIKETNSIDPNREIRDLENMANNIGEANYTILLIDIIKNEKYPIKDYILEGRELIANLNNAVEIKLNKRLIKFGIKKDIDSSQLDMMKKFIEETFPLNKIATREIDPDYGKTILKDFLKGFSTTPKPEMFKKVIRSLDLETLKSLTKEVLKENKDANNYIYMTRENIESILESDLLIPRSHIKDASYIVDIKDFMLKVLSLSSINSVVY